MGKLGKIFYKALSSMDIYSEGVQLQMKNSERFSTPIGQFFTVLIMVFTTMSFIQLTAQMLSYNFPNVVSSVIPSINKEKYYLTPENFFIAFGLADYNAIPIYNLPNKVYYTSFASFCSQTNAVVDGIPKTYVNCTDVKTVPCLQTELPSHLTSDLSIERLAVAECLDQNHWREVREYTYLNGLGSTEQLGYFFMQIKPCNYTMQNNCASVKEMDRLRAGYFQLVFTDMLLDQKKSGDPYSPMSKSTTISFQKGLQTYVQNTLRKSDFQSTQNFLQYFPQTQNFQALTLVEQNKFVFTNDSSIVLSNFLLDDKREEYQRNYGTLLDIFGSIGGFQQFLAYFIGLIIAPFIKRAQQLTLLNQIFAFDEDGQGGPQKSRVKFQTMRNSISNQNTPPLERRSTLKKFLRQKNKKLELRKIDHICMDKRKQQLLENAKSRISIQLEITNIINKMFEVEKLKHFLLNENQLKLFEYLPKPKISVNQGLNNSSQIIPQNDDLSVLYFNQQIDDEDSRLTMALVSYEKLRNSMNRDDRKLISMLDKDIIDFFDSQLMSGSPIISTKMNELEQILNVDSYENQYQYSIQNNRQHKRSIFANL